MVSLSILGMNIGALRHRLASTVVVPPADFVWPDATNTGVPSGTTLTTYTGPSSITTPQTFTAMSFGSDIQITAAGTYNFVNCKFEYTSGYGLDGEDATELNITNCTFIGPGATAATNASILCGSSGLIKGCDISGSENGIILSGTSSAQGNYIHDLNSSSGALGHYDGIAVQGVNHDCFVKDNHIIAHDTSGVFVQDDAGVVMNNITVSHNKITTDPILGDYSAPIYLNSKQAPNNITNAIVSDNLIEAGAEGGYISITEGQAAFTNSGNLDYPTGLGIFEDVGGGPTIELSSNVAYATSHTNTTFTAPTGILDDDFLVVGLFVAANTAAPTVTAPTGWTEVTDSPTELTDGTGFIGNLHVYYKLASSESGDYTFTHASASSGGTLIVVRGAETTIGPTSIVNGTGPTTTATAITTEAENALIVWISADWAGSGTLNPPKLIQDEITDDLVYVAGGTKTLIGSTGDLTQTNGNGGGASPWGVCLIAFDKKVESA